VIKTYIGGYNESVNTFMREAPKMFNEVLENSINETAKILSEEAKRQTPKEWGLQEDIEEVKHSAIKKASAQTGAAMADIILSGNKISLFKFNFVSRRDIMGGKTRGGVTINLAGNIHQFKHAFITDMGKGKPSLGIYDRIAGKRSGRAIRKLYTTNLAAMSRSPKTETPDILQTRAQEVFQEVFIKQCDAHLTAMGAK